VLKLYKYEINDPTAELNETLLDSKLINYRVNVFCIKCIQEEVLASEFIPKNMILTDYSF